MKSKILKFVVALSLVLMVFGGFFIFFPPTYQGYRDIKDNDIGNAMLFLIDNGIVEPNGNRLNPNDPITEGDVNDILSRSLGITIPVLTGNNEKIKGSHVMHFMGNYLRVKPEYDELLSQLAWDDPAWTRGEFMLMFSQLISTYLDEELYVGMTINGRTVIVSENVTLRDTVINGDLIVTGKIKDSIITLDNTWIEGRLILIDCTFEQINMINLSEINGQILQHN